MKKKLIIAGIIVVVAVIALIVINKGATKKSVANLYAVAKKGQFDIVVTTTGELQAENSADIKGPDIAQNRNMRSMDIKIQDLIAEGTEIKAGDYVATLDRTTFDNTLKDELDKLATYETGLETAKLDTAVSLTNYRDNIKNLASSVDEAAITVSQSKFEPPTTQRQAQISLEKAQRSLDQAIRSYSLQVERARTNINNTIRTLNDEYQRVADLREVLTKFIITAPSPGMVIYKRDRTGTKRKVGSSISSFDNVVATLPDMSSMISKTYVNEIDVSKVKPGQKVDILVDAFPERAYTGNVINVANIGEQLPNADAKVFEVLIKVDGSDPILRPSMTTGNKIVTQVISDVIYIPLESVQSSVDSIPFVYTKDGHKQVVLLGESNENDVIVEQGIAAGQELYLNTPEKPEKFNRIGEDLIPIITERIKAKKEEELKARQEAERALEQRGRMGAGGLNMGGGQGRGGNRQGGTGTGQGQGGTGFGQGQGQGGTGFGQGQGQQGGQRDTAAMRRMMNMRNQQGGTRDTSARRRTNTQNIGQTEGQNPGTPSQN
jgi:HlyD family secretion protein